MTMLHIVARSPYSSTALTDCLSFAEPDSTLVLIGGGVYGINHPVLSTISGIKLFAIEEDVIARGIVNASPNITLIDYLDMVTLTESHHPIQTWA